MSLALSVKSSQFSGLTGTVQLVAEMVRMQWAPPPWCVVEGGIELWPPAWSCGIIFFRLEWSEQQVRRDWLHGWEEVKKATDCSQPALGPLCRLSVGEMLLKQMFHWPKWVSLNGMGKRSASNWNKQTNRGAPIKSKITTAKLEMTVWSPDRSVVGKKTPTSEAEYQPQSALRQWTGAIKS